MLNKWCYNRQTKLGQRESELTAHTEMGHTQTHREDNMQDNSSQSYTMAVPRTVSAIFLGKLTKPRHVFRFVSFRLLSSSSCQWMPAKMNMMKPIMNGQQGEKEGGGGGSNDEIKAKPAMPAANFNRLRQMEQQNGQRQLPRLPPAPTPPLWAAGFACLGKNPEAWLINIILG